MATDDNRDGHLKTTDDYLENIRGKSRIIKRSIVVGHHKTSISLEDAFWDEFRAIARERNVHLSQLVEGIDAEREHSNLSSAIRIFVFDQRRRRQ